MAADNDDRPGDSLPEDLADSQELDALLATPQDRRRASDLFPLLYPQVCALARRERRRLGGGETLRTTALVSEVYLKLRHSPEFNNSQHFLRAAAIAMRHCLISYARQQLADKRGGGVSALPLEEAAEVPDRDDAGTQVLNVAEALGRLAQLNPRLAQVVECRFFAGYSEEETATALGLTARTVRRDWVKARAFLQQDLSG